MKSYVDYMMVLSPPENVNGIIKKHKLDAAHIIGSYESMHSKAHISIKNLVRQKPFMAEPEILSLKKHFKQVPPVLLTINSFDFFKHGEEYRTIYAKITSTPAIAEWFKILKRHLHIKNYLVPHITVARNIDKPAFDKLWPGFKEAKWAESFWIKELTVLQRETFDSFGRWEVFAEIPFEGAVPTTDKFANPPSLIGIREKPNKSMQISLF